MVMRARIGIRRRGQWAYIIVRISTNGRPIIRHTGERVRLADWDSKRGKPKDNSIHQRVMDKVEHYRNCTTTIPVVQYHDVFGFWQALIEQREKMPEYKVSTLDTYRRSLRKVRKYAAETGVKNLVFSAISIEFLQGFRSWMHQNGASSAYTYKTIGHFADVLDEAVDRGLYDGSAHRSKKLRPKLKGYGKAAVYLSDLEIRAFSQAELPISLRRVRDGFLIAAMTGLRFSDLGKAKADAVTVFRGKKVVRLQAQKTGKDTALPLSQPLAELLDRYPDGVGGFSIQWANRALKRICLLAGIEKAAQVTTHTARRSFATNEYLLAVSEGRSYAPIMRAMGHSSEKTFFRYIRLSALENADLLQKSA